MSELPAFAANELLVWPHMDVPRQIRAQQGPYQVELELDPLPRTACLGLVRFARIDRHPLAGVPAAIPAEPAHPVGPHAGMALTFGPSYKEADASWVPLAGVPRSWCDIFVYPLETVPGHLGWEVEYRIGGGPTLVERFALDANGLTYQTHLHWVVGGFRLQYPLFVTDGAQAAVPLLAGPELRLRLGNTEVCLRSAEPTHWWEIEELPYANHLGMYQNAYLQGRSVIAYEVRATIA